MSNQDQVEKILENYLTLLEQLTRQLDDLNQKIQDHHIKITIIQSELNTIKSSNEEIAKLIQARKNYTFLFKTIKIVFGAIMALAAALISISELKDIFK